MIKNTEPLSTSESMQLVKKTKTENPILEAFTNKFTHLKYSEAVELKEKLNGLGIIKMNQSDVSKVIDILPVDSGDLNKIFVDVSLDEDETKKILDTVKQYQ